RDPGHAASPAHLRRSSGHRVAEGAAGGGARGARGAERGRAVEGRAQGRGRRMSGPSSRLLELGQGRRIEVLQAGSGPPVLFLHTAGGIPRWAGALPVLSASHTVYAPLLPGFGQSVGLDAIDDHFDLFFHCFDVMEALGLERPYVVGESLGGWIAAEMA